MGHLVQMLAKSPTKTHGTPQSPPTGTDFSTLQKRSLIGSPAHKTEHSSLPISQVVAA